uniref:Uncharacterized protein n=1 Tax=Trypanosoma vivax (strain Y486) TaxID=1055687 RepID=G0UCK3_TRYVY|nr:hypothetical protein TVY486_1110470 [Trypanosoma vivax Y486]
MSYLSAISLLKVTQNEDTHHFYNIYRAIIGSVYSLRSLFSTYHKGKTNELFLFVSYRLASFLSVFVLFIFHYCVRSFHFYLSFLFSNVLITPSYHIASDKMVLPPLFFFVI